MTSQNSREVPGVRTGATGLLDSGEAIDARIDTTNTDVADTRKVGRRSRGPKNPRFFANWNAQMDRVVLLNYRVGNRAKCGYTGVKAEDIAKYLSKRFKTYCTKNSVIGRYNRKLKPHGRRSETQASPAVPSKAPGTPSLPKLKFLGDE